MEQTKKLAETLASSTDPKFQNSKFLQFVSKMSRGELILEDNAVKEVSPAAAQWANEFTTNAAAATAGVNQAGPSVWGEEFASFQANQHPASASAGWAQEFQQQRNQTTTEPPQQHTETTEAWADQFASGLTADWAEEFSNSALPADVANWEEEYLRELEKLHSAIGPRSSGQYIMAENNPFLTDLDSFQKGKDLFRKGVLTEAVLALEAECQRNPGNSEAWRLLGTVQAENDDDVQAIAALNRAVAADPEDLDALLSLGVSHTNELEQSEALGYLREWIMRHPTHGTAAKHTPGPPDSSQAMAYVIRLYEDAAVASPQDADVHAALGVLCNLSRNYDGAVRAFKGALALRPQDYSLWNKLGATLANSARSSEALAAYQKALELKPNYMRAWTNMGISLANIGEYEASAQYYVRALALNRRAVAVWGYLRNSLTCAAREDLMEAAEKEDLEALMTALPL
jgi:peroxin-5